MSIVVNGTNLAVPQPVRYSYDQQRGWRISQVWRGSKTAIFALMPQLTAAGWSFEVNSDTGQYWVLVANSSAADGDPNSDANVINDWSFTAGRAEKEILKADVAPINQLTAGEIYAIQTSINANEKTAPLKTADILNTDGTIKTAGAALSDNAKAVWGLMKAGQTSVTIFAPSIKHTKTVSNLYTIKAPTTNAGKVLTTAKLKELENPPASMLVDVPDLTYNGPLPLIYGWLKDYPEKNQTSYNKLSITQVWQFGLWETLTYGVIQ